MGPASQIVKGRRESGHHGDLIDLGGPLLSPKTPWRSNVIAGRPVFRFLQLTWRAPWMSLTGATKARESHDPPSFFFLISAA
jgi:hypothetical protein